MNKENFLRQLRDRLSFLPREEAEERIAFYNEMISDLIEDGLTEEEAVAKIGSVDDVTQKIMAEMPFLSIVKEKVKPKRKLKAWELVLLILGAPLWVPLVLTVLAVLASLYITVWAALICLWAADLSLTFCAVSCLIGTVEYIRLGNPAGALFALGAAAVCAGLSILVFFACRWLTKQLIQATGRLAVKIKLSCAGKEDTKNEQN
ncbi:MAG: DUF1700 domain-containing protein [Eubacterium sp.]|nr:DUF1700 domain-containing protein [Eubacterium sp.]